MAQARRKEARPALRTRPTRTKQPTEHGRRPVDQDVLDDSGVDRILEPRFGQMDGDAAAGFCSAALWGAMVWALLAFVLLS